MTLLAQGNLPVLADIAVRFAVLVTKWATRRRTRMVLRQLEPWQLHDVGLTPDQASGEAYRVFWKV
tara:strand:+ start:16269 stop:16466 length:198 start_codon:yes stop_codon:yes gene_type:complete